LEEYQKGKFNQFYHHRAEAAPKSLQEKSGWVVVDGG
jgi:hypothetical protein